MDFFAELAISGTVGRTYRIDYADDSPVATGWKFSKTISLTASPYTSVDVQSTNALKRFYRAVLLE